MDVATGLAAVLCMNTVGLTLLAVRDVVAAIKGATGGAEIATIAAGIPDAEVAAWECDAEVAAPVELGPVTGPGGRDTAGSGNCGGRLGA